MAAYVILDITVTDSAGYEAYKKAGAATLSTYGGKPLVRGENIEAAEGSWQPKRLVIIEFKTMEQAKLWWNSPEYAQAKQLRHKSAQTNVIFVEGL